MKLFAEVLNEMTSLDVVWDLTVMSHGQDKGVVNRAIEVVIYHHAEGHHEDAKGNGVYIILMNFRRLDPNFQNERKGGA
jgi:hypothetical protein